MTTLSGQPLAVTVTPANLHDLRQLMNLLFVKFPRVGGKVGRPLATFSPRAASHPTFPVVEIKTIRRWAEHAGQ